MIRIFPLHLIEPFAQENVLLRNISIYELELGLVRRILERMVKELV